MYDQAIQNLQPISVCKTNTQNQLDRFVIGKNTPTTLYTVFSQTHKQHMTEERKNTKKQNHKTHK